MANIASQIKRNRQNEVRRQRNKAMRSALKTHLKQFRTAVDDGDRTRAEERFVAASRQLDRAAGKGVVHRNYAANHKSRMAKRLQSL
ncbi:MAG TPA: 30S ribosomal protein S20 [Egibacteraceae bacterium]|jgi:small subunit ribosomal protein S20|nr:30S ribosomal protein S20 [Egibacteraceae bacterium]